MGNGSCWFVDFDLTPNIYSHKKGNEKSVDLVIRFAKNSYECDDWQLIISCSHIKKVHTS